jgi:hypothetical protein
MNDLVKSITVIATAVIGVAIISVLVKSNNTSGVIGAFGNAFSSILNAATGGGSSSGIGGGIGSLPSLPTL